MTVHDGYEAGFDVCIDYGKKGESYIDAMLQRFWLHGDKVEVKREGKALTTGNIYVEYHMRGRDGQWYASGIATTTADLWAYLFGDTGVVLVFPTNALRYLVKQVWRDPSSRAEHTTGENPTRGVLLKLSDLLYLTGGVPFDEGRAA